MPRYGYRMPYNNFFDYEGIGGKIEKTSSLISKNLLSSVSESFIFLAKTLKSLTETLGLIAYLAADVIKNLTIIPYYLIRRKNKNFKNAIFKIAVGFFKIIFGLLIPPLIIFQNSMKLLINTSLKTLGGVGQLLSLSVYAATSPIKYLIFPDGIPLLTNAIDFLFIKSGSLAKYANDLANNFTIPIEEFLYTFNGLAWATLEDFAFSLNCNSLLKRDPAPADYKLSSSQKVDKLSANAKTDRLSSQGHTEGRRKALSDSHTSIKNKVKKTLKFGKTAQSGENEVLPGGESPNPKTRRKDD